MRPWAVCRARAACCGSVCPAAAPFPLEALRIGADAFASDLNPVAVLLNKVVLEYIPKYGQRLADQVRTWGQWIKEQAEKSWASSTQGCRSCHSHCVSMGPDHPVRRPQTAARKFRSCGPSGLPRKANDQPRSSWCLILGQSGLISRSWRTPSLPSGRWHRCARLRNMPVLRVHNTGGIRADPVEGAPRRCRRCTAILRCHDPCRCAGHIYRLPTEKDSQTIEKAVAELALRNKNHQGVLALVPDGPLPPTERWGSASNFMAWSNGATRLRRASFSP